MKRRNEQFRKILRSVFSTMLIIGTTIVFSYIWLNSYNPMIMIPYVKMGNFFFSAIFILVYLFFLYSFDGLKFGRYRKINIIIGQTLAAVSTAVVLYVQIVLLSAEFVTVVPLIEMLAIDFVIIFVNALLSDVAFKKLFPPRQCVVIYDEYSPDIFLAKLSERKDKFDVSEVVNISIGDDVIEKLIKTAECVIIYDVHSEKRNKILKLCFENNVRTYATSKVSDILVRGSECLHLFDTPLLLYRNIGFSIEQRFVKRLMDIIVSLILLVLTSPIFLLCALAIKLYDGGPVFFRQARGTINGRIFYIHKFRSMIVDAEKNGVQPAENNDIRITPIGRFLRASRLDELPQFIDILMGNMSLVGPRPERIEHIKKYTEEIPEFQYRLKVRGGLTGYAQLYGKYNTSPYDKLQLDLMYIENYSLLLDLRLILMTVKIMFMKESTEGFVVEQKNKTKEK